MQSSYNSILRTRKQKYILKLIKFNFEVASLNGVQFVVNETSVPTNRKL